MTPNATRTLMVLVALSLPVSAPAAPWTAEGLDDYWITRWNQPASSPGIFLAMTQDRDGYLWLGSADGVFRFDGYSFQPWSAIQRTPLAGRLARTLFVDASGQLWVGFDEGGISRINGSEVRNYSEAEGLPVPSGIRAVVQDGQGRLWAGSLGGLFRFDGRRWVRHRDRSISEGPIQSAMTDSAGSLFVSTNDALFRMRAGSNQFERIDTYPASAGAPQSLCKDPEGRIVGTDPGDGFRIIGASGPGRVERGGAGLKVLCTRAGDIWVGTQLTGLWRVNVEGDAGGRRRVRTRLLGQTAAALLEDREQNVWVRTSAGLYRLTPRNVRTLPEPATALATDARGRVWVGTSDGLLQFTQQRDAWQRTRRFLARTYVRSVHVDRGGTVWAATNAGLTRLPNGARPDGPSWGSRFRQVASITSDETGALWFYDLQNGLYRVRHEQPEQLEGARPLRIVVPPVIHADRRGRLWILDDDGVRTRGSDGELRAYNQAREGVRHRSIYEDAAGVIWLGSSAGLSRVVDGGIESVRIPRIRQSAWVKSIVEDSLGQLWLGVDNGGVRLTRANFETALLNPRRALAERFEVFEGLPGQIWANSDHTSIQTRDGKLWFTTDEGIAIIDPGSNAPDRGPVPARVLAAETDDRQLDATRTERLEAGTPRLRIAWGALELTTPDRVRFRYRLDGFDRNWIDAESRREVEYANLPAGSYVFRVTAAREGQPWIVGSAASWEFTVAPHVYETTWFPFAAATAFAGVLWVGWYTRLAQVRRRFTIALGERARVSREVHDTLLQSLTGLSLQCQLLADDLEPQARERLTGLRRRVDDQIGEARAMIWSLRSPMLERSDIVAALRRVADDAIDGTAVKVHVRTFGAIRNSSPRIERELLRIAQEALTNAVRHGRPSLVHVDLHYERDVVRLLVHDNGRGFTPPAVFTLDGGHCGLAMMRERAEEIGGRLSVDSRPAQGASVEALVPLVADGSR